MRKPTEGQIKLAKHLVSVYGVGALLWVPYYVSVVVLAESVT